MSDAVADTPEAVAKSRKLPLLLGVLFAILGAGAGYYIMSSGLLGVTDNHVLSGSATERPAALPDIAFVEVDPFLISLTGSETARHLRFRAQLEVEAASRDDVEHVLPRVTDVLNGYLRALNAHDLEEPQALIRIRSQMLRRVQIVVGKGRVRDLLIMEFVLS
ncbi:flagellar basal body-associated FliL family protein [Sedimentitalea sp. JM2-8]|uniref:Flagellar protein FliL n=1 Tax=Sedimentitalea xiamensis TaxID=3050037 RepID=A0ABT7F9A7_9RHOB|nr:flagellar basal body-associated FliL family protein [Sedimentitalea xiamensis]MDK3071686.1 flagellar basal body-associated FliL family protein [Sedimentitalea xiamensis]